MTATTLAPTARAAAMTPRMNMVLLVTIPAQEVMSMATTIQTLQALVTQSMRQILRAMAHQPQPLALLA